MTAYDDLNAAEDQAGRVFLDSLLAQARVEGAASRQPEVDALEDSLATAQASLSQCEVRLAETQSERDYWKATYEDHMANEHDVTPDPTERFPGDPGEGNIYLGVNNGHVKIDEFDRLIYGSTPEKRFKTVREYTGGSLIIGLRQDIEGWVAEGRLPMIENKAGGYSEQEIATGAADADIRDNAHWLASLPGPVMWCYHHEPEGITGSTAQDWYRKAYRRQIQIIGDIAPNVCFVSPWYAWGNWPEPLGGEKDWRRWHPNWDGPVTSNLADGQWLTNGPFKNGSWVHVDGIDFYDPKVSPESTVRNKPWNDHIDRWYNHRANTQYPYDIPFTIGELGVFSLHPELDDNGVTVEQILTDMVEDGAVEQGLVAVAFWSNGSANWRDYDPGRVRRDALKRVIDSHPNVVML